MVSLGSASLVARDSSLGHWVTKSLGNGADISSKCGYLIAIRSNVCFKYNYYLIIL